MGVVINVIPHACQRYDTAGDWQWVEPAQAPESVGCGGFCGIEGCANRTFCAQNAWTHNRQRRDPDLIITVSKLEDQRHEMLLALHEFVEAVLCRARGISGEVVDAWDMSFKGEGEPGEAEGCPYRDAHLIAQLMEMDFAAALGVKGSDYEDAIAALGR